MLAWISLLYDQLRSKQQQQGQGQTSQGQGLSQLGDSASFFSSLSHELKSVLQRSETKRTATAAAAGVAGSESPVPVLPLALVARLEEVAVSFLLMLDG